MVLLLSALPAGAQFAVVPLDARSAAMGGCRMEEEARHVAVSYRSAFSTEGLSFRMIEGGWSLWDKGFVEGAYLFFGDLDYNEQQALLGFRQRVEEWATVGVRARYCRQATGDGYYEPQQWVGLSAWTRVELGRSVSLTAEGGTRPWDEERPWMARLSVAWHPVSSLLGVAAVESEERMRFRLGAEYRYEKYLLFRVGMVTAPLMLTFGLGFRYEIYRIDLAVEHHNILGLTPQISLVLWF